MNIQIYNFVSWFYHANSRVSVPQPSPFDASTVQLDPVSFPTAALNRLSPYFLYISVTPPDAIIFSSISDNPNLNVFPQQVTVRSLTLTITSAPSCASV